MTRVFWDTDIFIYRFECVGKLAQRSLAQLRAIEARGDELLTSALLVAELMTGPPAQRRCRVGPALRGRIIQ